MKKFLALCAALATMAGFYSCNDNKVSFGFYGGECYGIQYDNGSYGLVIGFGVNYTLAEGSITQDGWNPLSGGSYVSNVYEAYETAYGLSSLSGTYTFAATSMDGETAQMSVTVEFDEPVENYSIEDFEYNGSRISYTVTEKAGNANFYGFYLVPHYTDQRANSYLVNDMYALESNTADTQSITYSFSSTSFETDYITVYPAALYSSSKSLLIRLGEPKIIKRGENQFETNTAAE